MPNVVKAFAPATLSNLVVGFDILGMAIDGPGDEIIIRPGDSKGLTIDQITGDRPKLDKNIHSNTAGVAAHSLLKHLGALDEPISMEIRKKMPIGSGLGSSAASAVAAVMGINKYLKAGLEKQDLLTFAMEGERSMETNLPADNVATSLFGGMVLITSNKELTHKKLHIPSGLTAVVISPRVVISTKESRASLNQTIPLDQYVHQTSALAGFISGMYTSDFPLIKRSLKDYIFEPQRSSQIPFFDSIKDMALNEGAFAYSISGSGPATFALCDNTYIAENIKTKVEAFYKKQKIRHKIYISSVNHEGAFIF